MRMRLGLDLDNTLIYYDELFVDVARQEEMVPDAWQGSKLELKEYLIERAGGERRWMALQGMVYGKEQYRALLFKGVPLFLLRARYRQVPIWIVSHKTEYGHFDTEKTPLRQVAMQWMEDRDFFEAGVFGLDPERVSFASTREEKVRRIGELALTHFVDDLPEVFSEPQFPQVVQSLLLDPWNDRAERPDAHSSWQAIARTLFGEIEQDEIEWIVSSFFPESIIGGSSVLRRGNSQLFRINLQNGGSLAVKGYPDFLSDSRDRLGTEFATCRFLAGNGLRAVPKAIGQSVDLNMGLYEWIEGAPVTSPKTSDIDEALAFVEKLWQMRDSEGAGEFGEASEACLCPATIEGQVNRRLSNMEEAKGLFPELRDFLDGPFADQYSRILDSTVPYREDGLYDVPLPRARQTLSPSDFGFHNALVKCDGSLCFLDFEYFGWDDPVKLICDFLWHPGMDLSLGLKRRWSVGCVRIFGGLSEIHLPHKLGYQGPIYR